MLPYKTARGTKNEMHRFGGVKGPLEDDFFAAELRTFLLGGVKKCKD